MSRLEEIKYDFYPYDVNFGLSPDQVKYLIQQADRVEELETALKGPLIGDGAVPHFRKLEEQNQRYKQALEELRSYAMNLPIEREEDGSPIPDEEGRFICEITNEALAGESK